MASRALPFTLPKRITRSKTDLLKALSSTVGTDKTAPHFAFIDDPTTIPTTAGTKRNYFLAKEFGRRSARQLAVEWPTLFMFDRDKPRLEAFRPEKLPQLVDSEPVNEKVVTRFLDSHRVGDALKVYDRLRSEKTNLTPECVQRLFELSAYYNCENAPPSEVAEWPGLRLFYDDPEAQADGHAEMVELLFNQVPKTASTYSTMICWLMRFGVRKESKLKAIELFQQMIDEKLTPESSAFTLLIESLTLIDDVKKLLKQMATLHVQPSIQHFNAAIKAAKKNANFEAKWIAIKSYLAEAARLGLQPNLTTYHLILSTLGPINEKLKEKQLLAAMNALVEALDELESRPTVELVESTDHRFFDDAMNIAVQGNNEKIVDRVEAFYQSPKNQVKMLTFNNESVFYMEYFLFKIDLLNIVDTERLYKELVPRIVGVTGALTSVMLKKLEANDRPWSLFRRVVEDGINARHLAYDRMSNTLLEEVRNYDVTKLSEAECEVYDQLRSRVETGIQDIHEMREQRNAAAETRRK